jgi:hypothetical protein
LARESSFDPNAAGRMMFVLGLSAACWIWEFGLLEIARDPPRLNR